MIKKLKLDQTNKYSLAIACFEIANMLVDFIKGRKHYLSIGSEQGDIPAWDDIIIEKEPDYFIQIQVKRQLSDFGNPLDECKRNTIRRQNGDIEQRDLSPLDKTMKSLADWSAKVNLTNLNPKREFWIILPELNTFIKKDLKVKHLKDLCEIQIRQLVTTSQGLVDLAIQDSNIQNCYDWLESWCGFKDWDHILKALQLLSIKDSGTETKIEGETERILKAVFITDRLREARIKLLSYIEDNTTFTGAISPRNLLFYLQEYLHQDISTWTQFENTNLQWNISGINDLEYNTEIERPLLIVPKLWSNEVIRTLKIKAPIIDGCKLSEGLIRLAIHNEGLTSTQISDKSAWENLSKSKVGGTLGIGTDDFKTLTFVENKEQFTSSDYKVLGTISEQEKIAEELNANMLLVTWSAVKIKLHSKLLSMNITNSGELRNAVEIRWKDWKHKLDNSPNELEKLLANMLHPYAEGEDIIGNIRVGSKTVSILTDGMFLLLIISVCLDIKGNGNWNQISNEMSLNTISLQYWSGVEGKRKVRMIIDDPLTIIGKERANLLIMSNIDVSPSEFYDFNLEDSQENKNTLAQGKQLKSLITYNIRIRQFIDKGELEPLRKHLETLIIKNEELKQEAINIVMP